MNRRQLLVQKQFLNNEKAVIERLEYIYDQSLFEINEKIRNLEFSIGDLQEEYDWMDPDDPKREIIKSKIQSKIYQKQYQQVLQDQVGGILKEMQTKQFLTVSDYLDTCYEDGFVGSLFDLHGQDVPMMMPIDQEAMVRAVQLESKISEGLYTKLGADVGVLKKRITSEVTRSIATGVSYEVVAKRLAGQTKIGYNKAVRIARTEGHRIQCTAADDAAHQARDRGADVMKMWDATLDGKTRPSHRAVDGEVRELDEKFSNGLMFPSHPDGAAGEVINCRCSYLQRARWAMAGGFTKWNNFSGQLESFDSPEAYEEFKKGFFSDGNVKYMNYVEKMQDKYKTKDFAKVLDSMTEREYNHYSKLLANNPVYNTKAPVKPTFTPAKTIEEAEEYAKRFVVKKTWSGNGEISYKGLSVDNANKLNETLADLFDTYDLPMLENIKPMNFRQNIWKGSENAPFAYRSSFNGELYFNPKIAKNAKAFDDYFKKGEEAFEICKKNIDRFTGSKREMVERYVKAGRQLVADDAKDKFMASVQHEMGHHIQNQILWKNKDAVMKMNDRIDEYGVKISGYATASKGEYVAESFCAFMNGESDRIDPFMKEYFEGLLK